MTDIKVWLQERGVRVPGNIDELTYLNLNGKGLDKLPPEIGELVNLNRLNLANNSLSSLPAELGNLANLTWLDISNNSLSSLPAEIGNLASLTNLYISYNSLSSLPAELGNLANLTKLELYNNSLSSLPAEFGNLTSLTELYIFNNSLSSLPAELGNLANLQWLNISNNSLSSLPADLGNLTSLTELDISNNSLSSLPAEIGNLASLTNLYISYNSLSSLPAELGNLANLTKLELYNNSLSSLPAEFGNLVNLSELDVYFNSLSSLPAELGNLANLEHLGLFNNPLKRLLLEVALLPKLQTLNIVGCPLSSPPIGIANQGLTAIREYFKSPDIKPIRAGKLLVVGQGGVGKTSLLRHLCGEKFNRAEDSTHGLTTGSFKVHPPSLNGEPVDLNFWDFGGQDIYHATHQFFLSNNSLFILAWSARNGYEEGRLYYWLDMIQARAPQSPILIVATNTAQRIGDLPFADIQRQYPDKIIRQLSIDSETGAGIAELREAVQELAGTLPSVDDEWPAAWRDAAEDVKNLSAPQMSRSEFYNFLGSKGVSTSAAPVVTTTLHELGQILSYPDNPSLKDDIVVNPQWVYKYVSKVLDDKQLAARKGVLTSKDLDRIWCDLGSGQRQFFLELMHQFDLSYKLDHADHRSLVVELLSMDEDKGYLIHWEKIAQRTNCPRLQMRYTLGSVPAGVPTWFIARSHRYSTNIHWRFGGLFDKDRTASTLGLLKCSKNDKTVSLEVRGSMPYDFFSVMRNELDYTLQRFPGLSIKREIPCPGHGGKSCDYFFQFERVTKAADENVPELQCQERYKMVPVPTLLFGIDLRAQNEVLEELRGLNQKADEAKDLSAVSQRQILQWFQSTMDPQCPSLFILKPKPGSSLFGPRTKDRIELQLLCEAPGSCHCPVGSKPYSLNVKNELLEKIAPYAIKLAQFLAVVGPIASHSLPLAGATAALLATDFKANLDLANTLFGTLGSVGKGSVESAISSANYPVGENVSLSGAERRELHQLLSTLDPSETWAGLEPVLQGGTVLWLCKEHAKELRV